MQNNSLEKYYELSYYTLSLGDAAFIHQYIVDAYTAQNASADTKPIALNFALLGLYLYIEKDYTGREVQQFHVKMSQRKKDWPKIAIPDKRGSITITEVLNATPGPQREDAIREWCKSVWKAYEESRQVIIDLVDSYK
jgi:hypothetical protein